MGEHPLETNLSTRPQPFGVRNEMGKPKGAHMKPPEDFSNFPGGGLYRLNSNWTQVSFVSTQGQEKEDLKSEDGIRESKVNIFKGH